MNIFMWGFFYGMPDHYSFFPAHVPKYPVAVKPPDTGLRFDNLKAENLRFLSKYISNPINPGR